MIKLMAKAFIITKMVHGIKVSGVKISNMALAWRHGLMELATREHSSKAKNMVTALSSKLIRAPSSVNLPITTSTAEVFTRGLTAENMKASGKTTGCTVKALLRGVMDVVITESMRLIRRMGMESLFGLMAVRTKVIGLMANSTVLVCKKLLMVNGVTAHGIKVDVCVLPVKMMANQPEFNIKYQNKQ